LNPFDAALRLPDETLKLAEIEIIANLILEYLMLIDGNKKLSTLLALANEKSSLIDSRLEKIESLLGTLVAKIGP
jgi:hypothetical protein